MIYKYPKNLKIDQKTYTPFKCLNYHLKMPKKIDVWRTLCVESENLKSYYKLSCQNLVTYLNLHVSSTS